MDQPKMLRFAGGRQDGNSVPDPGTFKPGQELRIAAAPGSPHGEVYAYEAGGVFRFTGYSDAPLTWVVDPEDHPPYRTRGAAVGAALAKVEGPLRELAAAYEGAGGFPPTIEIAGWELRRAAEKTVGGPERHREGR